jgi:hypothetical protein
VRACHVAVVVAALVALDGCGTKPVAGPAGTDPSAAPPASLDPGTLDATSAYLAALGKLDQKLVADKMAALEQGASTCLDIEDKKTLAEQEENVATRFAVDAAQARKILAVAKSNLCLQ